MSNQENVVSQKSVVDQVLNSGTEVVTKSRKKIKNLISTGEVHIKSSFNNTLVYVTDSNGKVITWSTPGVLGFKGSKKSTPYAAQEAAKAAVIKAKDTFGLQAVSVYVSGPGAGREAALRAVGSLLEIKFIKDVTGVPHNGCRPEKERSV